MGEQAREGEGLYAHRLGLSGRKEQGLALGGHRQVLHDGIQGCCKALLTYVVVSNLRTPFV